MRNPRDGTARPRSSESDLQTRGSRTPRRHCAVDVVDMDARKRVSTPVERGPEGRRSSTVAWYLDEVDTWITTRPRRQLGRHGYHGARDAAGRPLGGHKNAAAPSQCAGRPPITRHRSNRAFRTRSTENRKTMTPNAPTPPRMRGRDELRRRHVGIMARRVEPVYSKPLGTIKCADVSGWGPVMADIDRRARNRLRDLHARVGSSNPGERESALRKVDEWLRKHRKTWNDLPELLHDETRASEAHADPRDTSASEPESSTVIPLDVVRYLLEDFVLLEPHEYIAVACWIVHTHLYDRFMVTPRLVATSPVRACGKTTLLELSATWWLGRKRSTISRRRQFTLRSIGPLHAGD